MFKTLRLKLALLNAAVAALILLAIAVVAYFFIARIITGQSERTLNAIVNNVNGRSVRPPDAGLVDAEIRYHYMVIRVDEGGAYRQIMGFMPQPLSDDQVVQLLTDSLTQAKKNKADTLFNVNSLSVRDGFGNVTIFTRSSGGIVRLPGGGTYRNAIVGIQSDTNRLYFVFLDIGEEEKLLASVRLALMLVVVGGLLLTLLGGLFLAGRALRPIRAAWQKQRSFVADASHELRSPLAAIRCNLDVVLDDPAAPVGEKQMYWDGISEETARMTVLVDELLLLARADSDVVVLQKERVDITETAESAVAVMRPVAEKKGIGLELETAAQPLVTGDRARLKQVLIALIDNAVKYTPEGGGVALTVRSAKDKAIIDVEDTGIGIAPEHLDKIFDRFYRVDKARESGGYGLGLSIAQWIVKQMGGSITAVSEEGKGSCFTVTLPVAKE